jgi:photosystem II stability/assembly factor-like uncharacterized protein
MLILLSVGSACAQWNLATSDTTADLRGIHQSSTGVIWASGTNGAVLRSEDNGYLWQQCATPPDGARLDFRAVFGWDANRAVVMSSGRGAASRLYQTADGCASWRLLFENPDPDGFWDAIAFHGNTGFILGDPVGGRFVVYRSDDLGRHWRRDGSPGLAAAAEGEGVFAASNSALLILPDSELLFATGGPGGPRVLRKRQAGPWLSAGVPMVGHKESAGVFSIAFRNNAAGVAVGGDYKDHSKTSGTAAWTADGGAIWRLASAFPSGYRSCVAWVGTIQAWIAVGPNGSDVSRDDGRTWKRFDAGNWNAFSPPWAAGPGGRIGSLDAKSRSLALKDSTSGTGRN